MLAQFRVLSLTNAINLVFGKIGGFVFAPYLFALGVEMDPGTLLDAPTADAVVAYAGILSTSVLVTLFHMPLMKATSGVVHEHSLRSFLGLAAVLANTRPANGLGWNNDNSLDFALVSIGLDANKPTLQMDWFGLVSRPTAVCNG